MQFKKFSNGVSVPVLGIGTWGMGGWTERDTTHDKEEIQAIKTAVELGMTHIDTAELYGNGHAEELVCEAIRDFEREKLFITTKVKGYNLKHDEVIEAAENSLKRMNIDYIDLYLIHWPSDDVPLEETMKAMDFLVDENLVRSIGVSNFSVAAIKESQKHTKNRIITNQIPYSLMIRNNAMFSKNMESETIPHCQKNNIMVTAYSPLAEGKLPHSDNTVLNEIAQKYGKTKVQVGLNWLISKPNIITIPKAVKIEHLKDIIGSVGWLLSAKDMRRLDEAF